MERMFFCGLEYSIEFIKLWLLVTLIFQIEVKKNIKILSALWRRRKIYLQSLHYTLVFRLWIY
jgi:hypothetical protein